MKKFFVALLAAAMVAGSALCASAADVKFSGSYYVTGVFADNWGLKGDDTESSSAVYGQRLRMGMEFKVAEGLTFNTRFDALEGVWGSSFGTYGTEVYSRGSNETNISFDRAWVTFAVPFGKFDVGRANSSAWGTRFGDNDFDSDQIKFSNTYGPFTYGILIEKIKESYAGILNTESDADYDNYHVYGMYKWDKGIAGLKVIYTNNASRTGTTSTTDPFGGYYKQRVFTIQPYAQAQFGPVFVEAELNYVTGKAAEYEYPAVGQDDVDWKGWNAYIHAKADIQNFYVGGLYAYVSGQDPNDEDYTVGPSGGRSWNPTLILWNEYTAKWLGRLGYGNANFTYPGSLDGEAMTNAHLFQIYAGMKPMPKLDIKAALSYAMADEKSTVNASSTTPLTEYQDDEYGTELDLTASYKIYDNLTYTVGFGYLWAGDYFKGTSLNNKIDDTYLLMHRLDLSF